MRPIGPIRPIGLIGLIGLMSLLSSCQPDEELAPQQHTIEMMGYVSWFDENVARTRAWLPPSGYSLYDDGDNTICISFTKDGEEPKNGHFFKGSGGNWRTNLEIDPAEISTPFYLYGYAPNNQGIRYSITDKNGNVSTGSEYSEGAIITLENVPTVMTSDLCVLVGARNGEADYKENEDYRVTGLQRGTFSYQAKAITGGSSAGNYIFLLFDHIYSSLNINMKVHADYNALRTIKIKDLTVQSSGDNSLTKEKTTVTVTLDANDNGDDPIANITFTPTGETKKEATVFHSSEGLALGTGYWNSESFFMPYGVTKLVMKSTYDVYDKQGNRVRENCEATNTFDLKKMFGERFEKVERGDRYTINLTIRPTYLYMLSEPDLDSPTMTVE